MIDVVALFDRLPVGWSLVSYAGRRYGAAKTVDVGGRSLKVYAEELGGSDTISAGNPRTVLSSSHRMYRVQGTETYATFGLPPGRSC